MPGLAFRDINYGEREEGEIGAEVACSFNECSMFSFSSSIVSSQQERDLGFIKEKETISLCL